MPFPSPQTSNNLPKDLGTCVFCNKQPAIDIMYITGKVEREGYWALCEECSEEIDKAGL